MNNSTLPYWLTLMVLLVISYGGWKYWQVQQFQSGGGIEFTSQPPLEEFELTERSGKPFRSQDMLGKVWVTTFFYASCPGSCKRLNGNIKMLSNLEELQDVTWVSITVDPEADTLEQLQEYAETYQADPDRWLFCRGDLGYIQRVGKDIMRLSVTWQGHNEHAVVIDRKGKIRGMFNAIKTSESKQLRKLLLECLEESEEEAPAEETQPTITTAAAA